MKVLITGGMGVIGAETSRKRQAARAQLSARNQTEEKMGEWQPKA